MAEVGKVGSDMWRAGARVCVSERAGGCVGFECCEERRSGRRFDSLRTGIDQSMAELGCCRKMVLVDHPPVGSFRPIADIRNICDQDPQAQFI